MSTIMPTKRTRRVVRKDKFVDDRDLAPFPTACPPWCAVGSPDSRSVRHLEYEAWNGRPQYRIHEGPKFGPYEVIAFEEITAPGVLELEARLDGSLDNRHKSHGNAQTMRQAAGYALAAAEWIETHQ